MAKIYMKSLDVHVNMKAKRTSSVLYIDRCHLIHEVRSLPRYFVLKYMNGKSDEL